VSRSHANGGGYDGGMDTRSVVCDVFRGDDEKDGYIVLYCIRILEMELIQASAFLGLRSLLSRKVGGYSAETSQTWIAIRSE